MEYFLRVDEQKKGGVGKTLPETGDVTQGVFFFPRCHKQNDLGFT
jgi:hypothetical protein